MSVLTFHLLLDCEIIIFFFLFLVLLFFFQILLYLWTYFSLLSPVSLTLAPLLHQEGTPICFASDHSFDYSCVVGLREKYGLSCGLKEFALIYILVSPAWKL